MSDRLALRHERFCLKNGRACHKLHIIRYDVLPESIATTYECRICRLKRVLFRPHPTTPELSDMWRHDRHTLKFDEIVVIRFKYGGWLLHRTYLCVKCLRRVGSIEMSRVE